MRKYVSTSIPEYLTVRSIVAVLTKPFQATPSYDDKSHGESHDFPELFYVREGEYAMHVGGAVYDLTAGQMIIYAPLDTHYGVGGDAMASIISFRADMELMHGIYNRVITLTDEQRRMLEAVIDEGLQCYERRAPGSPVGGMVIRDGISGYRLQKLKRDLELLLLDVYRAVDIADSGDPTGKLTARREQFLTLVAFMRERLGEELTVDDIARGGSMSVSKLKMLFREYTGGGPIDYFINMKIERAKDLIRMGVYTLSEVAEALGFSSLHYFSRTFKARVGVAPSRWEEE